MSESPAKEGAAAMDLQRRARLLEDVVENIPTGFTLYDAEGRLVLMSKSLIERAGAEEDHQALIGLRREEVLLRLLPRIKLFDGKAVTATKAEAEAIAERLWSLRNETVEIQLDDGNWRLLACYSTSEGGQAVISTEITERKRAEASLRDSEDQFRSIVEGNPSPVRVADLETWEIIYESPAAAALFGRAWPSDGGQTTSENYANPAARARIIADLKGLGAVDNREVEMVRTDGVRLWVALSSRVVRYKGRQVCVSSLVDLTENKRREAELSQARETLEDAIESLSEGLALYGHDDRLVLCNSQYKAFHKEDADLLVPGAHWREVTRVRGERGLFAEAAGQVAAWLEGQMAQRGIAQNQEFQASGGRWFEYSHRPTRQGGFVSTWRDITARKTMENALRDSEALLRQVLEACPLPIVMIRAADGSVIYGNPATRVMLGSRQDAAGDARATLSFASLGDARSIVARLRKGEAVEGTEVPLLHAEGQPFPGSVSARLVDYQEEEVVVAVIQDLTEQKRQQEELRLARETLHQSEKLSALGQLLAGVSHELTNPLSVLVGQSTLLKETTADAETLARVEQISKAADRCAAIVRNFLAMARNEPVEAASLSVNEAIEAALEMTTYALQTSGVEVSLDLAVEMPKVTGAADQLRQVFTNLIINAQQSVQSVAPPRKLRITSEFRESSQQVVVKIKDNGPGVPEDISTRIFEPLFTTKDVGSGTGMGLALCHRIVEAHGGTIRLESGPDDGAAFAVRLPVADEDRPAATEAQPSAAEAMGLRVLVVDDEYDVGAIISDVLQFDGHEVEVANAGEAALEKLAAASYDVILSDVRMPGMDGPSFYEAVNERYPNQVSGLAFITGDTLSPRVKSFLEASKRPFLEKPILPKDIRALIAQVMERKAP